MQIPLSWSLLREYVDIDLPPHELAHRLTMAGVEVGEVTELGGWDRTAASALVLWRLILTPTPTPCQLVPR